MDKYIINIDRNKCVGCEMCIKDCPVDNIYIENKKATLKSQNCLKCGHCVSVCPKYAVEIEGFEDEVIPIENGRKLDPKDVLYAIKTRRSIRHFKDKEVEDEIIESLIEAGRFSPTGRNLQDVEYIILKKDKYEIEKIAIKVMKRLMKIGSIFSSDLKNFNIDENFLFKKAPIVILIVSRYNTDASIASANIALLAESYGLGVLYSGFFTIVSRISFKIKKKLKLGRGKKVQATLVIGYPDIKYYRSVNRKTAKVTYR